MTGMTGANGPLPRWHRLAAGLIPAAMTAWHLLLSLVPRLHRRAGPGHGPEDPRRPWRTSRNEMTRRRLPRYSPANPTAAQTPASARAGSRDRRLRRRNT